MYAMSYLFMTRAACHAVVEAISHGRRRGGAEWAGTLQRSRLTQQDRRRYREKVRRCLDVFARMLRDSRFETSTAA